MDFTAEHAEDLAEGAEATIDLIATLNYKRLAPVMIASTTAFKMTSRTISWILVAILLVVSGSCVRRARDPRLANLVQANDQQSISEQRLNINTASANDLETLPGIGKGLAARIVEHREKFGPFRRTEDLIIVRGISDRRFRALRQLITAQ
jgi:competence ComEA-like helix-hairpin-helix protein